MTDNKTLPPLTLDDVRVAEPDRDTAEVVNPSETWAQACDKVQAGYSAADVAALLLSMGLIDTSILCSWWRDECMEAAALGAAREADCPDMALLKALNAADGREWRYPAVHGASAAVLQADRRDLLAEVARLTAERDEMRAQLLDMLPADGRDLGAENARLRALLAECVPGGISPTAWPAYRARVLAALGTTADAIVAGRIKP